MRGYANAPLKAVPASVPASRASFRLAQPPSRADQPPTSRLSRASARSGVSRLSSSRVPMSSRGQTPAPPPPETIEVRVTRLLTDFLKKNFSRAIDIFKRMDNSGEGLLDQEEFATGLSKMGLKGLSHNEGVMAFRLFDADGEGTISIDELDTGLRRMMRERAAYEEANKPRLTTAQQKRHDALNPWEKHNMTHLEYLETQPMPSFVAAPLKEVSFLMKKNGFKTNDIFTRKDLNTDGDENISLKELTAILAKVTPGVDVKKINRAFHYLDASGDGQLDHGELDSALRRARRDMAPRDALAKLAEVALTNPIKAEKLFALPQRDAMKHIANDELHSIPTGRGLVLRRREKELQRRAVSAFRKDARIAEEKAADAKRERFKPVPLTSCPPPWKLDIFA